VIGGVMLSAPRQKLPDNKAVWRRSPSRLTLLLCLDEAMIGQVSLLNPGRGNHAKAKVASYCRLPLTEADPERPFSG
jgi:hypothetical protein